MQTPERTDSDAADATDTDAADAEAAPARPSRRLRKAVRAAGAGTLGLIGAGLGEATYRRRLARDPEYMRLLHPLEGAHVAAESADGTELHAEVFGPDQAPTFVLIPGWTESLYYFDSMTRELCDKGFRVVAYDLRGQGKSEPAADGDWHIDRYGEDLEAVLRETCDGRDDVIVAGHSMGAMSIATWARHHDVGARVRAAALMNTGFSGLILAAKILPQVLPAGIAEPLGRKVFMGNALPVPGFSTALSRAAVRYVAFGPHASAAQVAFYERMLWACPPNVRASAGLAMCDMDLFDAMERITVPTLVLSGRLDRLTPPAQAERIAAELPNLLELIELPGIGHMGPLESPHQIVMTLLDVAAKTAREPQAGPPAAAVPQPTTV